MKPAIFAFGKALPSYSLSQMEFSAFLNDFLHFDDETAWLLEKIYKNSAIERRYSVLPDILQTQRKGRDFIGMSERNEIYRKEAPLLALKAAQNALKGWKQSHEKITHIISVSCTGAITPGIECLVAKSLKINPFASLLGINFMGCHGAFKALKVATKIALENPKNRILVICTELCTLHYKPYGDLESIVIQSLFADGSAAVIIGQNTESEEKALFEFEGELSYAIDETLEEMSWNASTEGFQMTLSPKVPQLIEEHIKPFVHHFLASHPLTAYEWAIHPGGKSILESVEKGLNLSKSQTESSWNILRDYGNLSSATFLYVLNDIAQRKLAKEKIVGLGFGPGLSVEGLLLKNCQS